MKQILKSLLQALNSTPATRRVLYAVWLLELRYVFPLLARGPRMVILFYRMHLKALAPYRAAALAADDPSLPLARRCDETFKNGIQRLLNGIADVRRAKQLNQHVGSFENYKQLETVFSYPSRIYLEMTDVCNLACPMCTQSIFTARRKHLSLEFVAACQPVFRYMDLISFVGCSEALMHPRFEEIVRSIPNHTATTRIITNGILINEKKARFLIEQGVEQLWFSLDATNPATFEEIRLSKQFELILDNMRRLRRLKAELGAERPRVSTTFVARRCNIEQMADFVRMSHELGAEAVHAGYLIVYRRELLPESLFFHQELSDRCMRVAERVAEELGIRFYHPGLFADANKLQPRKRQDFYFTEKCIEPYKFVYVRSEGTLSPCCVNDARLGALEQRSFDEIWNGPEYRRFRRIVNTPQEDLHCKHCALEGYKIINQLDHHVKLVDKDIKVYEEEIDPANLLAV